jgi:hypothetical protein
MKMASWSLCETHALTGVSQGPCGRVCASTGPAGSTGQARNRDHDFASVRRGSCWQVLVPGPPVSASRLSTVGTSTLTRRGRERPSRPTRPWGARGAGPPRVAPALAPPAPTADLADAPARCRPVSGGKSGNAHDATAAAPRCSGKEEPRTRMATSRVTAHAALLLEPARETGIRALPKNA